MQRMFYYNVECRARAKTASILQIREDRKHVLERKIYNMHFKLTLIVLSTIRTFILTCPISFSSFFTFLCSVSWGVLGLYFSRSAGDIEFLCNCTRKKIIITQKLICYLKGLLRLCVLFFRKHFPNGFPRAE